MPFAKRTVATAAGRPWNGEPGSLQLQAVDLDRLVVEDEAQPVEVVDRHVAEQRLVEEEVAVVGAEQVVEVEVAGDRLADRALAEQPAGEPRRREPAIVLVDHQTRPRSRASSTRAPASASSR